jgi:hypothetical protein
VQACDMMAVLKGRYGEDRSEADMLRGILEMRHKVQSDGWEQASYAYQSLVDACKFSALHAALPLDMESLKIECSTTSEDNTYVYSCIYENCSAVFHEQREWERHDLQGHDVQ